MDKGRGQKLYEDFFYLVAVYRLGKVIGKTFLNIKFPGTGNHVGGKRNHRCVHAKVAIHCLHKVEGFYTVHIRHAVVKENYVVVLFADQVKHFLCAKSRVHLNLGVLKQPHRNDYVHLGVVHNKNLGFGGMESFLVFFKPLQVVLVAFVKVANGIPPDNLLLHPKGEF